MTLITTFKIFLDFERTRSEVFEIILNITLLPGIRKIKTH